MSQKSDLKQEIKQQAEFILRNLCNYLPHYVFWKNKDCLYLGCNEEYAKLVELDCAEDIIGLTDADLNWQSDGSDTEFFQDGDKRTMNGEPVINNDEILSRPDGTKLNVLVNKKPIIDDQGEVIGVMGIATDISEHKRKERELIAAKRLAESANRTKAEFIANMSHDLRSPLNGIYGMAKYLESQPLDSKYHEAVHCIVEGSNTLLQMVEDVLYYSRIEAGDVATHSEPFNLRKIIEHIIHSFHASSKEKSIDLIIDYSEHVESHFIGDIQKINRVITNLVGNAVKFTDQGYVSIAVKEVIREEDKSTIMLTVEDTGMGIESDKLGKIFDRFEKGTPSYTSNKKGVGLGLTITKNFVEAMRGDISVETQPHVGSTFKVTLPLLRQPIKVRKSNWSEHYDNIYVLIIDDNEVRGKFTVAQIGTRNTLLMTSQQFNEMLAGNMKLANDIQVIIVDDEVESINLETLCDDVTGHQRLSNSLKLALLSSNSQAYKEKLTIKEFNGFVQKPVAPSQLLETLEKSWQQWTSRVSSERELVKVMKPMVLVVEDDKLNQRVVTIFLETLGCRVALAVTGQEALDQYPKKDFDLVLLDIGLPDFSGIEVAKRLRAMETYGRESPIIALTGHVLDEDRALCLNSGMNGFLTKPVSEEDLLQMIVKHVLPQHHQ